MSKVVSYTGKTVEKDLTRRIKNEFYIVGKVKEKDSGECYHINHNGVYKYFRVHTDKICWNYSKEEYQVKSGDLIFGYVSPTEKGYFERDYLNNIQISLENHNETRSPDIYTAMNEECLLGKFKASAMDGIFYPKANWERNMDRNGRQVLKRNQYKYDQYHEGFYSFKDLPSELKDKYNKIYNERNVKVEGFYERLFDLTDGISIGVEYEGCSGRGTQRDLLRHGLIPLKDGSVDVEYATVPLYGAKGLKNVFDSAVALKGVATNHLTSLHVHLGGISFSNEQEHKMFTLSVYMLYYTLQKELWDIIPSYKKSSQWFFEHKKGKDHCRNISSLGLFQNKIIGIDGKINNKELDKSFEQLFTFAHEGQLSTNEYNWKTRAHFRSGNNKWDYMSRYFNFNIWNWFFSKNKSSSTLEFRAHHGTTNPYKTFMWTLITISIALYAKYNMKEILNGDKKYDLSDIFTVFNRDGSKFGSQVSTMMSKYVTDRKAYFLKFYLQNDIYTEDFSNDSKYVFAPLKKMINAK